MHLLAALLALLTLTTLVTLLTLDGAVSAILRKVKDTKIRAFTSSSPTAPSHFFADHSPNPWPQTSSPASYWNVPQSTPWDPIPENP